MDQLIYKPGTTELCIEAVPEDLVESALMMVVPMLSRIVYTANVYYDITCGENTRVSRPDKACRTRSSDPSMWTKELQDEDRERAQSKKIRYQMRFFALEWEDHLRECSKVAVLRRR
jgi:hypothetical protein